MSSLTYQLENLYYVALIQNAKTAQFKKRSYDTIERVWQRIKEEKEPKLTTEYGKLSKGQKEKLDEFLATGIISAAHIAAQDPKLISLRTFLGIYGIGPAKAIKLIDSGIHTLENLKQNVSKNAKLLTKAQRLGLEYYSDLHERIPRKEIDTVHVWLTQNAPVGLIWRIVGSYRRCAKTSGDVDILVTGDGRKQLIDCMKKEGIIRHTLADGKKKFMGMAILPGGSKMRHIDIIETTREEFPFTSLYFTGSAEWNVKMRHQANQKGLRLNEHNYTHIKTGKPVSSEEYCKLIGKPYPETEQEVCDVIGWEWKRPHKRV